MRDADRHYLFILRWLGFESSSIDVEHAAQTDRGAARTRFTKLVQHAFDGLVFQTTRSSRWIVYLGFRSWPSLGLAPRGVLLGSRGSFATRIRAGRAWPCLLLLLGGFIILSLGVTGLYVGKIFGQVKERPLYVVDDELNYERRLEPEHTEDAPVPSPLKP